MGRRPTTWADGSKGTHAVANWLRKHRLTRKTDRLHTHYALPLGQRLCQNLRPPLLPPTRQRDMFQTEQVRYLGRHCLCHILYRGCLCLSMHHVHTVRRDVAPVGPNIFQKVQLCF